MSSLRPEKIVASSLWWLGGSLFLREGTDPPVCSCPSCHRAWLRLQSPDHISPRARVRQGLRAAGSG